jgi:hypothetical protein
MTVTVAADNTATGVMTGTQYPGQGNINGSLPPTGQFSGTIAYDAQHTYAFQGPVGLSQATPAHLTGTVNQDFLGNVIAITVDLVKQ